jgi:hypothetical protein
VANAAATIEPSTKPAGKSGETQTASGPHLKDTNTPTIPGPLESARRVAQGPLTCGEADPSHVRLRDLDVGDEVCGHDDLASTLIGE